jgi:hypothetical protein
MNDELENSIPLESIILDPRNEETLVTQARIRVFNESKGVLNDFSENSPVAALIQGQAFAGAELLYYINRLPLALVIDFLKITGVERRLGTKAVVTLTFTLSAPVSTSFVIPEGFEVVSEDGNLSFFTDTQLIIPAGLVTASVTATAEKEGTEYNLPAYSLNGLSQPLTFLSAVTNESPSAGGTTAETEAQTITRALSKLRLRNLVSASDYELAAQEILGEGSRCKAIGLLGPSLDTNVLGAVHLFLLNSDGNPANDTQLSQVKSTLGDRIQLGSSLYTSPMNLLFINANLICNLTPGKNPEEAADILFKAYSDYLDPRYYPLSQDVILNEVEYALRLTGVIKDIELLTLNDISMNIPLPNDYTLPVPQSLVATFITSEGFPYPVNRGSLDLL